MTIRAELYLWTLLENPGQVYLIKKMPGQTPKKEKNKERQETMTTIETSLRLAGIAYRKWGDWKISILVPSHSTKNERWKVVGA